MNNKKKDNTTSYSLNWGVPSADNQSTSPLSNWFGASPIPTSNIFASVNVDEIAELFKSVIKPQMPSSTRLLTITGSEVFVTNDIFELMNVSLILVIKEQIEKSIFKHENNAVLDFVYTPQINGASPENYYTRYEVLNNDMRVINAMTQATSRLVNIFKEFGIDLTSDLSTNRTTGIRFREIFMSAYVICMQIIIKYNIRIENKKKQADANNNMINAYNPFAMPTPSNIESEHKSVFDGVKPDENGMFNVEFGEDFDKFSEIIDKAREYELNNDNKKNA